VKKSFSDISKEAHYEAAQKVKEAMGSDLFVFKAQKLLKENEALIPNGKHEEVLWNCERILGIVGREDSLNLMDSIKALLAQIKNFAKAVAQNNEDADAIKERALKVEDDLKDGNLYRAKRDLSEILADLIEFRPEHIVDWSRHTGVELNEKMDLIMIEYKNFPDDHFRFNENPFDTLSGYLEEIMYATLTEEYDKFNETIMKFYNFFYQFERYLREEQGLLGQVNDKGLIKIVLDKDGDPVEYDVIVDTPSPPGIEEDAMKGIYSELRQIDAVRQPTTSEEPGVDIESLVNRYVQREETLQKENIIPASKKEETKVPKIKSLLQKGLPFGKEGKSKKKKKKSKKKKSKGAEETWEQKEKKFETLVISTAFKTFCGELVPVLEQDRSRRLLKLESLGFKFFLNSDYGKALIYYHLIVKMDAQYKDAWKKRDECYEKLPDGVK